MLQLFLELNNFGHLKMSALYNNRKLTSFSNHLPYDWRRMVKLSEGYGSIEDELLEVLEELDDWSVNYNHGKEPLELSWSNSICGEASIDVSFKEQSVVVKKVVKIEGESLDNFVVLGNELIICLQTKRLIRLSSSGAWNFCDYCSQLEENMTEDFTVLEDSDFSSPVQFLYSFTYPSDLFEQIQVAKVPSELFFQMQLLSSGEADLPIPVSQVDAKFEIHIAPEQDFQTYVVLPVYNVGGTYVKASVQAFHKSFKKKCDGAFFGFDAEQSSTHQLVKHKNGFRQFEMNGDLESQVFASFSNVFKGKLTVLPNELCFRVSKQDLHLHMADVLKALEEVSVPFFMKKKPVHLKQAEITIDIDDEKTPQIVISGEQLATNFWLNIQEHMDVFESEHKVYFLDKDSQEAIQQIAQLVKEQTSKQDLPENKPDAFRMLDWFNLQQQGVKIQTNSGLFDVYQRLLNFESIPVLDAPKNKKIKIRDYQRLGFSWLAFLHDIGFGACLADDMGLGKTIQVLTFILAIKQGIVKAKTKDPKHLIVVPPSLLFNWESEVARLFLDLKTTSYFGQNRKLSFEDADIVITTYDTLRIDAEELANHNFETIIFDEAQFTKNLMSKRAQAVRKLRGEFTVCLTGTPLENSIYEYYAIIDLAIPGIFGSLEDFQKFMGDGQSSAILHRAKPFVLRRTKDEILKELPRKTESNLWLNMNEGQKKLYTKIIQASRSELESGDSNTLSILTGILRLRQICAAPELLKLSLDKHDQKDKPKLHAEFLEEARAIDQSPKVEFLINKIRELHLEGHSVLIYSQFKSMLDVLEPKLQENELKSFRLDGSTPVAKRKKDVQAFQESEEPSTYLISLKAGGVGLNLTRATVVFFVEPWWNPAVENQAADRTHRIGQNKPVFVYRLLMANSIEEKMMDLKDKKKDLFKKILTFSLNDSVDYKLKKEDLMFLLQ